MPGDGTKLDTTKNSIPLAPVPARLLDLTRLIRRAGRRPTGVDRVELAYLRHLSHESVPLFALVRTTLGYVLLGPKGVDQIAARLSGAADWGRPDLLARLSVRAEPLRRAESDLRRCALARSRPRGLARMLRRYLPNGFAYLNVGHSDLTAMTLRAVRQGGAGRIAVLIHDAIPLDYPQYQRPGVAEEFAAKLQRVRAHADLVIYNSADTRARVEHHMQAWGLLPPGVVAHLGVELPSPGDLPAGVDPARPYFVALGTIEPRKGHDVLLDLWEEMGAQAPALLICGARGWNNEAVFARLDALPPDGPVRELSGLDDGQIAAVLAGATGLLFPSRAEGYGLPPMEAAALGVPVIATDLPAIREVLSNIPVYAKESDLYQWLSAIKSLETAHLAQHEAVRVADFTPPSWEDHFNLVLRLT